MQELGMGGWVLQLLRLQLGAGSLDAGRCSNIDGITILAATAAAAWHLQRRRHERGGTCSQLQSRTLLQNVTRGLQLRGGVGFQHEVLVGDFLTSRAEHSWPS